MSRLLFISLLILFGSSAFTQSDTLNQLDANGKKTGWWLTYLNEDLNVLNDSVGATHCMYNYFRRSIHLYRFGEGWGTKKSPVIFPENDTTQFDNYTLLNGIYITKFPNGNLRSELFAVDGYMTSFKRYHSNGVLKFELIISEECGAPLQHCVMQYRKDGSLKYEAKTYLPKESK